MNLISKAATTMGALTLAVSSFATNHIVERCPSVDAIKTQGLSMVLPVASQLYLGMESGYYDTPDEWLFFIGPVYSDSFEDAIDAANEAIKTISGAPTPEEEEEGMSVCEYNTGNKDMPAIAISGEDILSTAKIKRIFPKKL